MTPDQQKEVRAIKITYINGTQEDVPLNRVIQYTLDNQSEINPNLGRLGTGCGLDYISASIAAGKPLLISLAPGRASESEIAKIINTQLIKTIEPLRS